MATLSLNALQALLTPHFLEVLGEFACEGDEDLPKGTRTLVLMASAISFGNVTR